MDKAASDRAVLTAALAIAAITLIRVIYLAGERFPLYGDEAQYWAWSTDLDWGYYSKPPMIAWLIRATTSLVGVREMGVRLSAPLIHAGTAMLVLAIGTRLFNARVGAWSAVIYASLPAVSLASMVMSTDTPLGAGAAQLSARDAGGSVARLGDPGGRNRLRVAQQIRDELLHPVDGGSSSDQR